MSCQGESPGLGCRWPGEFGDWCLPQKKIDKGEGGSKQCSIRTGFWVRPGNSVFQFINSTTLIIPWSQATPCHMTAFRHLWVAYFAFEKKCSMLYTVRLNTAELASARCVKKMDMEDMQPNSALILQSLFMPLLLDVCSFLRRFYTTKIVILCTAPRTRSWTFPRMCLHCLWFLDLRFDRKHQLQHDETLRGIQPVEDPTAEPPPSEKQYKRAVLSITDLQMISRDTPFLRCQADQQSVHLDSGFE